MDKEFFLALGSLFLYTVFWRKTEGRPKNLSGGCYIPLVFSAFCLPEFVFKEKRFHKHKKGDIR